MYSRLRSEKQKLYIEDRLSNFTFDVGKIISLGAWESSGVAFHLPTLHFQFCTLDAHHLVPHVVQLVSRSWAEIIHKL